MARTEKTAEQAGAQAQAGRAEESRTVIGRTGAEELTRALAECQVDTIFGYPGGAALPIYDAMAKTGIRHVLVRHESAAAHAADGYARSTGQVGVCMATSGPGMTNLITGLLTAQMDGVPLVAITGQVPQTVLGTDAFQEADTPILLQGATKAVLRPKSAGEVRALVHYAVALARSVPAGVVVLDLPKDVAQGRTSDAGGEGARLRRPRASAPLPDAAQVAGVWQALTQARRPLVLVGHGAQSVPVLVRRLLGRLGVPSTSTLLGLGVIPSDFPGYLGMAGMHGTREANTATLEADFLLVLGARLDDRVVGDPNRFLPKGEIAQVVGTAAHLGRSTQVARPIHAEVGAFLHELLRYTVQVPTDLPWGGKPWIVGGEGHRTPRPVEVDEAEGLLADDLFSHIAERIPEDAYIVTDVGQHQMWAALYAKQRQARHFITSGGLGTMGFGLPAALGVQAAHPKAPVYLIVGDGGFLMSSNELATAVTEHLPVRIILADNRGLGMVRQWQELFYPSGAYQVSLGAVPDLLALTRAFGIEALEASTVRELDRALLRAGEVEGPIMIHAALDSREHVYPMIPPGQSAAEMLTAPPGASA